MSYKEIWTKGLFTMLIRTVIRLTLPHGMNDKKIKKVQVVLTTFCTKYNIHNNTINILTATNNHWIIAVIICLPLPLNLMRTWFCSYF